MVSMGYYSLTKDELERRTWERVEPLVPRSRAHIEVSE